MRVSTVTSARLRALQIVAFLSRPHIMVVVQQRQHATNPVDLSNVLTPKLFDAIVQAFLPLARDKPLDFDPVGRIYFLGIPDTRRQFFDLCFYQALKPLSKVGLVNFPDLLSFLPPPTAKNFPVQALGFVLLLDQMPRSLCTGTNVRYMNGYFDLLAQRLVTQFAALPPPQRPDTIPRMMSLGWSFDFALVARIWFIAPFIHSERMDHHVIQLQRGEEMRRDVEKLVGVTDPNRKTAKQDSRDVYLFGKLIKEGPPQGPDVKIQDFSFWAVRVFDVHTPIIRKFGHYPDRNAKLGRLSTEEEKAWIKRTWYAFTDEETAKQIREDVLAGVWRPFQDQDEPEPEAR